MKIFDVIAGLLLLISALNGLMKGAADQVVRVMSFLVAAVIAIYCLRFTGPIVQEMMDPEWMAAAVAMLVVFVIVYLVLRIFGANISQRIQTHGALSALDRTVGMGFGLLRAFVVLGMFNLLFHAAAAEGAGPAWVAQARLFPLTEASGKVLKVFAPRAGEMGAAITSAVRQGATYDPEEGYSDGERRRLDDLVETTR